MSILPSITVVMPTLNCAAILRHSLESIVKQDYPKNLLEIFIIDGGSTDETTKVAESYGAKTFSFPELRSNQEGRRAIGIHESKAQMIASIDSDNVLVDANWLLQMVEPLLRDPEIFATQPLWYHHDPKSSLLNRYFALFGVNDPVAYYLNKRDKQTHFESSWKLLGSAQDCGNYFKVTFNEDNLPTVGCNGFVFRREIMLKARCTTKEFFHIDVNLDLVRIGYNKFGITKNSVLHLTGDTFFKFLYKRSSYMKTYYLNDSALRRYKLYQATDLPKLIKYILYSLTMVEPLTESARGYIRKRDVAWFLHPVMCLGMLFIYSYTVLQRILFNLKHNRTLTHAQRLTK